MLVEHRWGQFRLHTQQIPSLSELQNNLFPPVRINIYINTHKTEASTKLMLVTDTFSGGLLPIETIVYLNQELYLSVSTYSHLLSPKHDIGGLFKTERIGLRQKVGLIL